MDAKAYLTHQFASLRYFVDIALAGLTDEQLTWIPPGTANSIGLTALHMLALLISHTLLHAGEIAALKGVNGVKGLPF
jgi:hypothetical protein